MTTLGCGLVGGIFGTAAAQCDGTQAKVLALVGTVALFLATYCGRKVAAEQTERGWARVRATAESLKKETWLFLMAAPPYESPTAEESLATRVTEISSRTQDLDSRLASYDADSKDVPNVVTLDDYVQQRVSDQIDRYYRPAAKRDAARARQLRNGQAAFTFLAGLFGAVAAFGLAAYLSSWIAVLTNLAAAFAAHSTALRLDANAAAYLATARQLEQLRDRFSGSNTGTAEQELVLACENAISGQNDQWLAERTK